jgi:hypothetical protein
MVDNTQANWNVIIIVYGSKDPSVRMVDEECTCLFNWIQSFNKHTKQLIKPKLQGEHYWKQLENKQEMKHSRFMKWNNHIN